MHIRPKTVNFRRLSHAYIVRLVNFCLVSLVMCVGGFAIILGAFSQTAPDNDK